MQYNLELVKFLTKKIRANKARKFIKDEPNKKLLDIGSGDKSFIRSFKKLQTIGIDKRYGHDIEKGLEGQDYEKNSFNFITMLAVIEHLDNHQKIIKDCHKILKEGGLLIITTPLQKAEKIIKLYSDGYLDHKKYLTKRDFCNFKGLTLLHYSTFEIGLNQLIVLKKVTS